MFTGNIQIKISQYITGDIDLTDIETIQQRLEEDLFEIVPVSVIQAAIHAVRK